MTGTPASSGHRYGTCHTGHHGHRNSGVRAGQDFFVAPGEHERVPAFEADHETAGPGPVDHDLVDRVLGHGPSVRDLGGVDDFHVRRQFGKQFRWREAVSDHDIGLGEQAAAADGDQLGVAGPAADQRYRAAHATFGTL